VVHTQQLRNPPKAQAALAELSHQLLALLAAQVPAHKVQR